MSASAFSSTCTRLSAKNSARHRCSVSTSRRGALAASPAAASTTTPTPKSLAAGLILSEAWLWDSSGEVPSAASWEALAGAKEEQSAPRHLLRKVEEKLPVGLTHASEERSELLEKPSLFARTAPGDIVRGLPLREIWQFRRLFAIVEELVEGNFEGPGKLLQRFDGRDSMCVLNPR